MTTGFSWSFEWDGVDDDEIRTGNAMVLDPYGRVLAECGGQRGDVVADLDLSLLGQRRGGSGGRRGGRSCMGGCARGRGMSGRRGSCSSRSEGGAALAKDADRRVGGRRCGGRCGQSPGVDARWAGPRVSRGQVLVYIDMPARMPTRQTRRSALRELTGGEGSGGGQGVSYGMVDSVLVRRKSSFSRLMAMVRP